MKPSVMKRAGVYLRLSTEDQVRGEYTSLEHQLAQCQKWCEANGLTEIKVYEDRGISGGKADRPSYRQLQADISEGQIQVVVAYKLERICRDAAEGLRFSKFLNKNGCQLVSVTEPMDTTTPIGRLNTTMVFGFAEYERNNISVKVRSKQSQSAQKGYKTGGNYPFGYLPSDRPGVPQIVEEEASWVRELFELIAAGENLSEIAAKFEAAGLRTRVRTVKRRGGALQQTGGVPLRADQLKRLIRNPIYKGYVQYNDILTEGKFEAIVSDELWAAANKALDKLNETKPPRIQDRDKWFHPLKGVLICGDCGSALTPHRSGKRDRVGKPYRYYDCQSAVGRRPDSPCGGCRLPASLLEQIIAKILGEVGKQPAILNAILGSSKTSSQYAQRKLAKERNIKRKQLEELNEQMANLRQVAMSMGISGFSQDLIQQAKQLEQKKEGLLAEMHYLDREIEADSKTETTIQSIQDSLSSFDTAFSTLAEADQKELISLTVREIKFKQEHRIPGEKRYQVEIILAEMLKQPGSRREPKLVFKACLKRSRAYYAEITEGLDLSVGAPPPRKQRQTRQRRKHPIHEALGINRILHDKGWSAAEYARRNNLSRAAVTKILNWLKLEEESQEILFNLNTETEIRKVSQKRLKELRGLTGKKQVEALRNLLANGHKREGLC